MEMIAVGKTDKTAHLPPSSIRHGQGTWEFCGRSFSFRILLYTLRPDIFPRGRFGQLLLLSGFLQLLPSFFEFGDHLFLEYVGEIPRIQNDFSHLFLIL